MTRIVDTHPHVISPDTTAYPLNPIGGVQSSWSQAQPLTHDELIDAMNEAGIDKAVLVQASTAYGHDNRYLADAVAAHPDRFTGVFSIDPLTDDAIDRIEYWRAKDLTGLRLFTAGSTIQGQASWLNDPRSHAMWRHASQTALPVCVQMRPPGLIQLAAVLERFPETTILIDHLARSVFEDGPPYMLADDLWHLARFPNVNLKLTLRNIDAAAQGKSTLPAFLDRLVTTYGAGRVAWGSNFPAAGPPLAELVDRALSALDAVSPADREQILSGTALRLYPALAQGPAA